MILNIFHIGHFTDIIHPNKQSLIQNDFTFQVPLVPFLPAVSIFACILLMVSTATLMNWIGCLVVFALGE